MRPPKPAHVLSTREEQQKTSCKEEIIKCALYLESTYSMDPDIVAAYGNPTQLRFARKHAWNMLRTALGNMARNNYPIIKCTFCPTMIQCIPIQPPHDNDMYRQFQDGGNAYIHHLTKAYIGPLCKQCSHELEMIHDPQNPIYDDIS